MKIELTSVFNTNQCQLMPVLDIKLTLKLDVELTLNFGLLTS